MGNFASVARVAPPSWRRVLALVAWMCCALGASLAQAGTIEAAEFKSNLLGRNWTYNVYLPTGYEAHGALRYPVLYLLHGNGGNRNDWAVQGHLQRTVDALIASGDMPPALIVMPDAGTTWYVDLREKIESAFFTELIPHIEKSYKTLQGRDGRVIAGLSMGGYGALRYALAYPEKFQAAALLSPAIYNPEPPSDSAARAVRVFTVPGSDGNYSPEVWKSHNYPVLWDAFLKKNLKLPIYIVAGDDDEFFIEAEAVRLYELLRRHRQPAELRIVDGRHDWPVWGVAVGEALRYVFHTVRRPQAE